MAVSVSELDGLTIVHDTDANITPEKDVRQGPTTLYHVHVANGVAGKLYLSLYDALDPTYASDEADEVIQIDASDEISFPVNPPDGLTFVTGLSFALADSEDKTAGANPGSSVAVTLVTS